MHAAEVALAEATGQLPSRPRMALLERDARKPRAARDVISPGAPVIQFRDVSKVYGVGAVGLDGATFSINRGEFVFLVGSTGSGKSTIMRLLIKELEPTQGTIRVAGHDLAEVER